LPWLVRTLLSWSLGFERNAAGTLEHIADAELQAVVQQGMGRPSGWTS